MTGTQSVAVLLLLAVGIVVGVAPEPNRAGVVVIPGHTQVEPLADSEAFRTGDRCIACHKGVSTTTGVDVSIGYDWRASMMANSARDPYWQAAVRRELMDHPQAREAIEAKCSRCHMPMASEYAALSGQTIGVFENLPIGGATGPFADLAADGVSCSVCHQVSDDGLGTDDSFTGGFRTGGPGPDGSRAVFGPFEPDPGGVGIMRSATGYTPTEAPHVQSSELCATCHTLMTHAVTATGEGPEFPEQVPYLEWQASDFARAGTRCQDCHMPAVSEAVPVTQVLGRPRDDVSRHVFRGGNFFMLRLLNRYRDELGVAALPHELALAAERTEAHLRDATADVSVAPQTSEAGSLAFRVDVSNRAGHKFPTAYPSRRAWLHVTVTDAAGVTVFESGRFQEDGSVAGNDGDTRPDAFEAHHTEIRVADQVQVYEAVMTDGQGGVTTGLMSAEQMTKDNRLLSQGFDPGDASGRTAVRGAAADDADFGAAGDRVRYRIATGPTTGPFTVAVELWFQPHRLPLGTEPGGVRRPPRRTDSSRTTVPWRPAPPWSSPPTPSSSPRPGSVGPRASPPRHHETELHGLEVRSAALRPRLHPSRTASAGWIRAARRAGIQLARSPTNASNATTPANTLGSVGSTS